MRPHFFSTTMTLSPSKTASTSITLLPASPQAQTPIKKEKEIPPKTLNDIPIRLLAPIFHLLDPQSCSSLARTSRRFYVAYKSCTVAIPPPFPSHMWETYAEIGKVRRMILDGDEEEEVKKMLLEYKSRLVRDRIREERGWDEQNTASKIVYEERREWQWARIERKLKKAERREKERIEMQMLIKAEEEEKSKRKVVGRVFAWFGRG